MTQQTAEERARELREAVGRRLRQIREAAGLTQNELADQARVDRSNYNQIENGRRGVGKDVGERLALALGITLTELGLDHLAPVEEWRPLADRQEELRDEVRRLVADIQRLGRRVAALERQAPPEGETASDSRR